MKTIGCASIAAMCMVLLSLAGPARAELGSWEMMGKEGDFKGITFMAPMNGALWMISAKGDLLKVDKTGKKETVGKPGELNECVLLAALDGSLWTVEGDGDLYRTGTDG